METKRTINSVFMVPTLKIPKDKLKENGFINAFECDADRDVNYPNSVYMLFRPKNLHTFREFLDEEYERTTNIIDDYDYNNGFVVVVYKLNSTFLDDFNLIKEGKYSQTSKKFQLEFSKTTKVTIKGLQSEEISLHYRIFNKTQDLINFWEEKLGVTFDPSQELWEGYYPEKEILTTVKLKEYV